MASGGYCRQSCRFILVSLVCIMGGAAYQHGCPYRYTQLFPESTSQKAEVPVLSSLAECYLSVPATSIPSEQVLGGFVFTAGAILTRQQPESLRAEHVDCVIFLKKDRNEAKHDRTSLLHIFFR